MRHSVLLRFALLSWFGMNLPAQLTVSTIRGTATDSSGARGAAGTRGARSSADATCAAGTSSARGTCVAAAGNRDVRALARVGHARVGRARIAVVAIARRSVAALGGNRIAAVIRA